MASSFLYARAILSTFSIFFALSVWGQQNSDIGDRTVWCKKMWKTYGIVPRETLGRLPKALHQKYILAQCWKVFWREYEENERNISKSLAPSDFFMKNGKSLVVPQLKKSYVRSMPNFKIVSPTTSIGTFDGDIAMAYVVKKLNARMACQSDPTTLIVDVGGLYGDFALMVASWGCRVAIFEPQMRYAQHIARSVQVNRFENSVKVYADAVSTAKTLQAPSESEAEALTEGAGAMFKEVVVTERAQRSSVKVADGMKLKSPSDDSISGVKLDDVFADDAIFFLKVDVEGFEGEVLKTAVKLFEKGQIRHAAFEFSPTPEFEGRGGTDYATMLDTLSTLGAKTCYCLHRKMAAIFEIQRKSYKLFYQTMKTRRFQTDIYCSFEENSLLDGIAVWSPSTALGPPT